MRIFLTGATGQVGSAALDALLRSRHDVTALVRNSEQAAIARARGASPVIGNLAESASWLRQAAGFDAYIHAAYEESPRAADLDRRAIDALLETVTSTSVLMYTSSLWVLGDTTGPAAEDAPLNPPARFAWRLAHERLVLDAARTGLRTIVVRPGIVYGGSHGIIADLLREASNGLMRVIGPGENHWAVVYDRDVGELYARLIASHAASGVYHANDEGDERVSDIVAAIAAIVPVRPEIRHMPLAEARKKMGSAAEGMALDQTVRSVRARGLGWTPTLHSVCGNATRLFEEWKRGWEAA